MRYILKKLPILFQRKDQEDDWFESDNQRELRQIFQGQSQIFELYKELNRKIDEVIGRQERTLSLIAQQQSGMVHGGQAPPPAQGVPPVQTGYIDTIKRHEVDGLFTNQNLVLNQMKELR